ncbi:MMPL family transporter [Humidisolicoccus flavus]|uniref:MMPL family transporter n=1 Tax=Humidisolicoccus flavus TaxID=3111414 RepID=UPI00324DFD71
MSTKTRPRGGVRAIRILLPALLIVAWFAVGSFGGMSFGTLSKVVENDQAAFLPASAEATKVQELLPDFLGDEGIPAIIVMSGDEALSEATIADLDELLTQIGDVEGVDEVSPLIPSEDEVAVQAVAIITDDSPRPVVEAIRAILQDVPNGIEAAVTGPAGFTTDLAEAFSGIDGILLLVAIAAVFVILVIVYRSPLLPILVLLTSVFALCAAILLVSSLAGAGVIQISGQTQGILFILVIGAATDYGLLYVARYREELANFESRWDATKASIRGVIEPILASGGTVIAGLLCLLLSDLNSNRSLGPVAALGIVCAIVAGLTLLPALLLAFGKVAYWPRKVVKASEASHGIWTKVAKLVDRRRSVVWITTTALLGAGAVGLVALQPDGVPTSEFVTTASESRDGQALLAEHFPAGAGSPAYVTVPEDELDAAAELTLANDGVESVSVTAADSPSGTLPYPLEAQPPGSPFADVEPTVANGEVLLQVTLSDAPDSDAAQETIRDLRAELHSEVPDALVGGTTAVSLDTKDTSIRDRNLIIPIILVVILGILMLLLRAIIAPIILILTTVLSFATALGLGALILQALGKSAMDPSVPLFSFVFLVALGIDYNIFLMTRVREETVKHGHHEGIRRGLTVTGGVITSAGVVLAATFAALGVIPILFLLQLAIIVSLGVLIDTIIVRSLQVPAIAHVVGPFMWWPSKLRKRQ